MPACSCCRRVDLRQCPYLCCFCVARSGPLCHRAAVRLQIPRACRRLRRRVAFTAPSSCRPSGCFWHRAGMTYRGERACVQQLEPRRSPTRCGPRGCLFVIPNSSAGNHAGRHSRVMERVFCSLRRSPSTAVTRETTMGCPLMPGKVSALRLPAWPRYRVPGSRQHGAPTWRMDRAVRPAGSAGAVAAGGGTVILGAGRRGAPCTVAGGPLAHLLEPHKPRARHARPAPAIAGPDDTRPARL
jgi:hypothetical protein